MKHSVNIKGIFFACPPLPSLVFFGAQNTRFQKSQKRSLSAVSFSVCSQMESGRFAGFFKNGRINKPGILGRFLAWLFVFT